MIHSDNLSADSRIISPAPASQQEEALERALRPKLLDEYVGQEKIRGQLQIFIEAARKRKEPLDHVLLFGFASCDERAAFRQLLKISGVGPKLALSVLSGLSLADLADAVARKEAGRLTKIPGVGKKTAECLLLELQGKFSVTVSGNLGASVSPQGSDVVNALLALGYSAKEAEWAAKQLPVDTNVSGGIRQALKLLSKG